MNDPKLEYIPIVIQTLCRLGCHVFIHTGMGKVGPIPLHQKCTCGTYTWSQWEQIMRTEVLVDDAKG